MGTRATRKGERPAGGCPARMKPVLLALVALGLALAPVPFASAHHTGCEPDYPCTPFPPCDAKCWITHLQWVATCTLGIRPC